MILENQNNINHISVAFGDGDMKDIVASILNIFQHMKINFKIDAVQIGQEHYKHGQHGGILPSNLQIIDKNKILLKGYTDKPKSEDNVKDFYSFISEKLSLHTNINIYCNKFIRTKYNYTENFCIITNNKVNRESNLIYRHGINIYEDINYIDINEVIKTINTAIDFKYRYNYQKIILIKDFHENNDIDKKIISLFKEIKNSSNDKDFEIIDKETACNIILNKKITQKTIFITDNIYGNFLSNIIQEIYTNFYGSGLCLGDNHKIFEALKFNNIAYNDNIYSVIYNVIKLLEYTDYEEEAQLIYNSLNYTTEENLKRDIITENHQIFIEKLIKNLGNKPKEQEEYEFKKPIETYQEYLPDENECKNESNSVKKLAGADILIEMEHESLNRLIQDIANATQKTILKLQMIILNNSKIWPYSKDTNNDEQNFNKSSNNLYNLRFISSSQDKISSENDITELLEALLEKKFSFIKIQNLYIIDNKVSFPVPCNS